VLRRSPEHLYNIAVYHTLGSGDTAIWHHDSGYIVEKVDIDIDFIAVVCYKIARFPCEIIASQRMIAAAGGH
jgi:hypothetical protein